MIGKEPPTTIEEYFSDAWVEWLRSHTDEELNKQADEWGAWCPADDPGINPDLVMMKWESACDELDRRKREEEK